MSLVAPAHADTLLRDTMEIAQIPAPTGREGERIAWLLNRLRDTDGTLRVDHVGNLVWSFGEPPYDVMVLTHVDTVFAADVSHDVADRGGWLWGPGIGDNSVAIATTVEVVETLGPVSHSFAVVFTVEEEGLGSLRGARHACATLQARTVIGLEGHGLDSVFVEAVGCVRAQITLHGPGGHSWWDQGRPSATHELVHLLEGLLGDCPERLALNVGQVHGGTAVNVIAQQATALVEGRSLDEQALEELATRIAGIRAPDGIEMVIEILDRRPCGRIEPEHRLVQAVLEVRRSLGLPPTLTSGSTDANAALALGIPALSLGCTRGRDMHTEQERIDPTTIALGAAQLEAVLHRLLCDDCDHHPANPPTTKDER